MTLRTRNHGNYGIFFIMGNAGFLSSAVMRSLIPTDAARQKSKHLWPLAIRCEAFKKSVVAGVFLLRV